MRRSLLTFIILAFGALATSQALASEDAAGTVDPSFGQNGTTTVAVGTSAGAAAVVVQPDGRIVTAGEASISGQNVIVSTRMTPDGSLDPSYGDGGIVTVPINGSSGVDSDAGLALEPGGKILIAGSGRTPGGGPLAFAAVRLNPDGSLDQSFGRGGITTVAIGTAAIANAVAIEPDGKIVLAGTAVEGHNEFAAVRLNSDGSLDQSFGTGGVTTFGPTGGAWGMALQPDGRIVLVGQTAYGSNQAFVAARLLDNGALDQSFGDDGAVTVPIGSNALGFGVAVVAGGKIVLAGPAYTNTLVAATVRLNPDGSRDGSYGQGGVATYADPHGINALELDPAGRMLLPAGGPSVVRLNADGTPDDSFGSGGSALAVVGTGGAANAAAVTPEGDIVLAGATTLDGQIVITVTRLDGDPVARVATTAAAPSASAEASKPVWHTAHRHTAHRRSAHRQTARRHDRHHRHHRRLRLSRTAPAARPGRHQAGGN